MELTKKLGEGLKNVSKGICYALVPGSLVFKLGKEMKEETEQTGIKNSLGMKMFLYTGVLAVESARLFVEYDKIAKPLYNLVEKLF